MWAAAAATALSIAGCVTMPAGTATRADPAPAAGEPGYRLVVPNRNAGTPRTVYLVRTGEKHWDLHFEARDLAQEQVERIAYWPASRQIAFDFERGAPARIDQMTRCNPALQQRRRGNYSPCSTQFKVPDNPLLARVLVGVASGGMSEADMALKNEAFFKLDAQGLLAVASRLQLHERVARRAYQEAYAHASGREQLAAFAAAHVANDPDGLAAQASRRVAALDENAAILRQARAGLPEPGVYRSRYTPADPVRYCNRFRRDAEAFGVCRQMAPAVVAELAQARAAVAQRFDLCTRVFRSVGGGANPNLCRRYAASQGCTGSAAAETRTCNVLLGKG